MTKCFEGNIACIRLVLRIVLEIPDLEVTDVRTQVFVENLLNRSVRLDVLATDSSGRKINVKIQRADKGAGRKRARYNSSMMDAMLPPKSENSEELPETYIVFITEHDVLGDNQPLYQIERYISGSDKKFGDGSHILYVNGACRDESPIGKLMHDFACTDPRDMHYDVLADRVKFFKESQEGVLIMCRVMEEMRNESLQEGMRQGKLESMRATVAQMLSDGSLPLDKIAAFVGLPLEELKKLQAEQSM